jgi:hypothetical protein
MEFPASIMVWKDNAISHGCIVVEAESKDEALGKCLRFIKKHLP